jgi:MoaA/NifB/PqqE/SkfB family radical SAM enzyme
MRPDILELLSNLKKMQLEVRLETNGSLVTREVAANLSSLRVDSISFTLDSLDETYHKMMRGPLRLALKGLDNLLAAGFSDIHVNATISRRNFREIPSLIQFLGDKGIDSLSLQAIFVPTGHPLFDRLSLRAMTNSERMEFFSYLDLHAKHRGISEYHDYINRIKGCLTEEFAVRNECPMSNECITLDPFGNLFACPHQMNRSFIGNAVGESAVQLLSRYSVIMSELETLGCIDERCVGFHPHTPQQLDTYRERPEAGMSASSSRS